MIRDIDVEWIKDEKLLTAEDEAAVVCNDCSGCHTCCSETGCMIVLDEYDVKLLKEGTNYSFEGMLNNGMIQLDVVDGVVLPGLGTDENGACVFLGENGRCSIHQYRPGICRLFPLARIYHEDGSFSYFLQESECDRRTGEKVKVKDWLGYKDIKGYEEAVVKYHDALVELREKCANAKDAKEISFLQTMFLKEKFF